AGLQLAGGLRTTGARTTQVARLEETFELVGVRLEMADQVLLENTGHRHDAHRGMPDLAGPVLRGHFADERTEVVHRSFEAREHLSGRLVSISLDRLQPVRVRLHPAEERRLCA